MAPTPALSAEEKNARMTEERAFLTKLLESSLQGDFDTVKQHVQDYRGKHNSVSEQDVLSQFKDGKKRTAVHFMSQSSSPEIIEKLIQWFVDSDQDFLISILKMKDINGMTPLMMCAQNPDPQLACQRVKALLQVGGKPLALARSNAGAGALHYAAGAGALAETINALVEAGKVALFTPSRKGGTPLHWAAALRDDYSETTLKALVEAGADLNITNESGLSPLLLAAAAGNDKHAKYLVKQGADVTKELPGNITIYHMAADCNLVGTLAILLEKYPDQAQLVSQPNGRNEKPIDLAVQEGHLGCVMLLTGESDEDKAKAFMAEHRKSLPERNDASTKPESAAAVTEPKKDTAQYSLLEEHAKELGAKAAATSVSDEDKARAQDIKKEGNQHYIKKEWQLAIDFYTKAIDADPTDATFYSNRSACYMHLKQHNEALQDAVICRHLRPTWPKGCFRMAVARLALKRYEDAALSAWEGLQQDQDNDELKSLLQKCVKQGRKVHQDTVQKDHEEDDT